MWVCSLSFHNARPRCKHLQLPHIDVKGSTLDAAEERRPFGAFHMLELG